MKRFPWCHLVTPRSSGEGKRPLGPHHKHLKSSPLWRKPLSAVSCPAEARRKRLLLPSSCPSAAVSSPLSGGRTMAGRRGEHAESAWWPGVGRACVLDPQIALILWQRKGVEKLFPPPPAGSKGQQSPFSAPGLTLSVPTLKPSWCLAVVLCLLNGHFGWRKK